MEPMNETVIDPHRVVRRLLIGLLIAQALVLAGDLIFNFWDVFGHTSMRRIFNIAREQSVPTWFASLQAFGIAVTGWALGRVTGRKGWYWVGLFFLYISIDDAATIHERVGTTLDDNLEGWSFLANYPSFAWQVVVAPVLAVGLFASALYIWIRRPNPKSRLLVFVGLAAFAVAQGIDFLEGIEDLFLNWSEELEVTEYSVGHSLRTTEEMLEMLGTLALWTPMLWQLADAVAGRRISVGKPEVHSSRLTVDS